MKKHSVPTCNFHSPVISLNTSNTISNECSSKKSSPSISSARSPLRKTSYFQHFYDTDLQYRRKLSIQTPMRHRSPGPSKSYLQSMEPKLDLRKVEILVNTRIASSLCAHTLSNSYEYNSVLLFIACHIIHICALITYYFAFLILLEPFTVILTMVTFQTEFATCEKYEHI
jgi:hypothetical protein